MKRANNKTMQQLDVRVERVKNTSEGFSVYTARDSEVPGALYTVKQFSGPVRSRQRWVLAGSEVQDPRWGTQFVAQFAALGAPRDDHELAEFLTSGLIEGWNLWSHDRLMRAISFGDRTAICRDHPDQLLAIEGISPEMVASLQAAWQRGSGLAPIFAQLADWGCTSRQAEALVKHYGAGVVNELTANPYAGVLKVYGYGWNTAESIGEQVGIALDDPRRIQAGLEFTVHQATWEAGHTWLFAGQAAMLACSLLTLPEPLITRELEATVANGYLIRDGERIYPAHLYAAEQRIAAEIARRNPRDSSIADSLPENCNPASTCSPDQWDAVLMALNNPISLLTGGPGTGKTTTLTTLISRAMEAGAPVTLMAPTGKAAARMTEATGFPATTIHSRLKIVPGQESGSDDMEPLTGMVIIDEISMLDTSLAAAMLAGISPAAQILLVGDPDQLPSVGPGAVLRDLLKADVLPRVHLDHVFRNEAGIAVNAARMRAGENIVSLPDCQLLPAVNPEHAQNLILAELIRAKEAGQGGSDILVLTPTNDGPSGRYALNALLQPLLNPGMAGTGIVQYVGSSKDPDGTLHKRQEELCQGDRVMVIRNNSELGVFNGQVGTVVDLMVPRSLDVEIDGRVITFAGEDRRLLTLAYALTGHKSQGSEAPTVISPIFPSRVLSREWLYTVITRARERCILIGDTNAIQGCIKVQRSNERRTGLVDALKRTAGE